MCLPPLGKYAKAGKAHNASAPANDAHDSQKVQQLQQLQQLQRLPEIKVPEIEESISPLLANMDMDMDMWLSTSSDTLSSPDAFATVPSNAMRASAFEDVLVGVPPSSATDATASFVFPAATTDMEAFDDDEDSFDLNEEPVPLNRALKREASFMDDSADDVPDDFQFDDSQLDDSNFALEDTKPCKKQRKRKPTRDLPPAELAKTREINRIAAQRHRMIAKQKKMERERRLELVSTRNEELRNEAQKMNAELATLKKLIVNMYGPGGPRAPMMSTTPQLSTLPALSW